jgi:hypothetical protein
MKKFIIISLLLVSCSSESETTTVETVEAPQELQQVSNTTTTTEVDLNKLGDEFIEYYLANKIEGYLTLTTEEASKTTALHNRTPSFFELGDLDCFRKERGTTHEGLLNEYFPVIYDNSYYFREGQLVLDDNNAEFVYMLNVSYNCKLKTDDQEYPDWLYLYGNPFYKDGKWWIYQQKDWEPVPMDVPSWYSFLATRVEIKNFEPVYEEWVVNAVGPEIIITNCPDEEITDTTYELKYEIKTGNAGMSYFGTFVQQDGENVSRAFFEKGWNDDVFTFPPANSENSYGQLIDNSGNTGVSTYRVDISTTNEYDLYDDVSCTFTFNN